MRAVASRLRGACEGRPGSAPDRANNGAEGSGLDIPRVGGGGAEDCLRCIVPPSPCCVEAGAGMGGSKGDTGNGPVPEATPDAWGEPVEAERIDEASGGGGSVCAPGAGTPRRVAFFFRAEAGAGAGGAASAGTPAAGRGARRIIGKSSFLSNICVASSSSSQSGTPGLAPLSCVAGASAAGGGGGAVETLVPRCGGDAIGGSVLRPGGGGGVREPRRPPAGGPTPLHVEGVGGMSVGARTPRSVRFPVGGARTEGGGGGGGNVEVGEERIRSPFFPRLSNMSRSDRLSFVAIEPVSRTCRALCPSSAPALAVLDSRNVRRMYCAI